jgi:hypothetical protein
VKVGSTALSRGRIARTAYLRAAALPPAERCALAHEMYSIYCETVQGYTRDEFEALVFGSSEVSLALFYGPRDELAGFSHCGLDRVRYADRTHGVFRAGTYFSPGYHGGASSVLFGLRETLRIKLREPRTPLAYLTRGASPAVYRLLSATFPCLYPSRTHQTPEDIDALVRLVGARWGYVAVGESPWVVRSVATPLDAARLRRLDHDPDVRFYEQVNPRFAEGDSLLIWMPLDVANIAGAFFHLLRARLGR